MSAGHGIVHSERTELETQKTGQTLHGIQTWIALPEAEEKSDPAFLHYQKSALPVIENDGITMHLIIGEAFGHRSPVQSMSPICYLAVNANAGAQLELPSISDDCALYVVSGSLHHDAVDFTAGDMIVFEKNARPKLAITTDLTAMILGGKQLGDRHIWWNFVSSSKDTIEKAKNQWQMGCESEFQKGIFSLPPGETEFIPAPEQKVLI